MSLAFHTNTRNKILIISIITYLLAFCKNTKNAVVVKIDDDDTSIVTTAYQSKCKIFYSDYKDSLFIYNDLSRWNPTKQDIIRGDSILIKCITTFSYPSSFIKNNIYNYNRQYFGLIDKKGNKILWVNCLYKESKLIRGNAWLNRLDGADDGGDHFFNITISLEKNTCIDVHINN